MTSTVSSLALAGAIIIPSNVQTTSPALGGGDGRAGATTNSVRASIPNTATTTNANTSASNTQTATPTAGATSSTPNNLSSTPGANAANSSFAFVEEKVYKKEKQILLEFDLRTKGK